MMYKEQIVDVLAVKLERVHFLADVLVTLLEDDPKAQVIATIIMETAILPES